MLRSRYGRCFFKSVTQQNCSNVKLLFIKRLRIVDAKLSDSGNYSCHYSTATEGDSVMVHVINGKCFLIRLSVDDACYFRAETVVCTFNGHCAIRASSIMFVKMN